jgi:hypothetical protein
MFIKLFLLLLALLLERCHVITTDVQPVKNEPTPMEIRKLSNDITGTWRMEKDSLYSNTKNQTEKDLIFSFFKDSSFTIIGKNGSYQFGKYASKEDQLTFDSKNGKTKLELKFSVTNTGRRTMVVTGSGERKTFAEYAYPLKNDFDDPFYPDNNLWRLKPDYPEPKEQLRQKLINYLHHNCLVLKAATDRNQAVVSWEFSPGIVKILNGGIGIESVQRIPASWLNCFYSREEAMEAYRIFEVTLRKKAYTDGSSGNWARDDYRILSSVYEAVQKPI